MVLEVLETQEDILHLKEIQEETTVMLHQIMVAAVAAELAPQVMLVLLVVVVTAAQVQLIQFQVHL
jgi:hypothetical protein